MNQEQPNHNYQLGDYVDFNYISWIPKLIIEINSENYTRLKDIRNNIISDVCLQSIQPILITNNKIKPFRTETQLRGSSHSSILMAKWKPINIPLML